MRQRIETLRDWAENRTMAPGDRSDLKWAIQELDRLAARVEELEEKKDNVWKRYDSALMENQRLREALEEWYDHHNMNCRCPCCLAVEAALKETP